MLAPFWDSFEKQFALGRHFVQVRATHSPSRWFFVSASSAFALDLVYVGGAHPARRWPLVHPAIMAIKLTPNHR